MTTLADVIDVTPALPCIVCGTHNQTVPMLRDHYQRWQAGELLQVVVPEMPAEQREFLISGTHPECWDRLFGGEE